MKFTRINRKYYYTNFKINFIWQKIYIVEKYHSKRNFRWVSYSWSISVETGVYLRVCNKLFGVWQSMNRDIIVMLKLYIKSLLILLSMGVSVHFGYVESETGREQRSSEKMNLILGMCFHF